VQNKQHDAGNRHLQARSSYERMRAVHDSAFHYTRLILMVCPVTYTCVQALRVYAEMQELGMEVSSIRL
jgi:hypothetical protein